MLLTAYRPRTVNPSYWSSLLTPPLVSFGHVLRLVNDSSTGSSTTALFLAMAFSALVLTSLALSFLAVHYYRRSKRISIGHVPGPEPESYLLGNLRELYQSQAGEADFKWQAAFGDVVRINGVFGDHRLMISDPKALQYIYQTSGYNWPKQLERRELSLVLVGKGLTWADGLIHKKQRKVMLPGFGVPETRAFVPLFFACVGKLSEKWKDMLSSSMSESVTLNIPAWVSRATLDAIGEAAFDYQFGATDDLENELARSYANLMAETFGFPSLKTIFLTSTWGNLPAWLRRYLSRTSPKFFHARETERISNQVAESLIASKADALLQGEPGRDIMSLLVRSNASENEKNKISDEELLAQMRTIILAGHETVANSLTWALFELAKHPDVQRRLRDEIWQAQAELRGQGRIQFEVSDFDSMPYTTAVIKEVLRFHPVSYNNFRQAGRDDIIPLSKPIKTANGDLITNLPVPKGLKIVTSIAGYNRNPQIFGEDAHTFNPDRWLGKPKANSETQVGVYANLLTFAGGIRSCIGWRFAVYELHAFLIDLVSNFEFEMTPEAYHIRREACLVMVPTVEGQTKKGVQLPLQVRIAVRG